MSTRTPPLQPRSRFHGHWGSYGNPVTGLPNQPGNVLAASVFPVLEPGDTAFVGESLWVCQSAGTVGGGDAVWRLAGPDHIDTLEGLDAGAYYEAPAVAIGQGAAAFSAIWYGYFIDFVDGAGQFLFGHTSGSFDGGWGMLVGGRSGSSPVTIFENYVLEVGPTFIGANEGPVSQEFVFYRARPWHLAIAYDSAGVGLTAYLDGVRGRFSPAASGAAFLPSPTGRLRIGLGGIFGLDDAPRQGMIGAAYLDGVALTATQVEAHLQACRDADFRMVDGGLGLTHYYDMRTEGSAPATLTDLAGNGGDLTRVGAPVFRRRRV